MTVRVLLFIEDCVIAGTHHDYLSLDWQQEMPDGIANILAGTWVDYTTHLRQTISDLDSVTSSFFTVEPVCSTNYAIPQTA